MDPEISAAPSSVPKLAELAARALQKQSFPNRLPDDPLHGLTAFNGVATIYVRLRQSVPASGPKYQIDVPGKLDSTEDTFKKTLSSWEKARNGHGLRDKSAPIYVIFVEGTEIILRIGFPRVMHTEGENAPLGGHIDLASKKPVLAGGQVLFSKPGEAFAVKAIDNQSGHYQPNEVVDGLELKSPKTITAFAFRQALQVEIEGVYSDPEEEKKKAQELKEEKDLKGQSKLLDLTKATPAEEKLQAFFTKVAKDGGFGVIRQKNLNPYVQTLANAIGRAKYGGAVAAHLSEVQGVARTALETNLYLKDAILEVLEQLKPVDGIRVEWVEQNAK